MISHGIREAHQRVLHPCRAKCMVTSALTARLYSEQCGLEHSCSRAFLLAWFFDGLSEEKSIF